MKLTARPSPHNSAVTLFEASSATDFTSNASPRRSKRVKVEKFEISDIEDIIKGEDDANLPLDTAEAWPSVKEEFVETVKKVRKASASPKKPKPIRTALDVPHPAPENWRETYDAIKSMREKIVAPVDTMGCDQIPLREIDPKVRLCTL